ncbi:MAG TPA: DUF1801 domain-containing protein [Candidatus Binatia bacterium]
MAANRKSKASKSVAKPARATADSKAVERYMATLVHPLKSEVEALRQIILKADARISEGIKWNAPSFYCGDWFATFDLRSMAWVQIVFHRGAKAKTPQDRPCLEEAEGIVKWITNDRCVARFVSGADVAAKTPALTRVVAGWVQSLSDEPKKA